jgi:hypothetical protein
MMVLGSNGYDVFVSTLPMTQPAQMVGMAIFCVLFACVTAAIAP